MSTSVNRTMWNTTEIRTLERMAAEGRTSTEIGEYLGRPAAAIRARALRLNIALGPRGRRRLAQVAVEDPFKELRKEAEIGSGALLKAQLRAGQYFVRAV